MFLVKNWPFFRLLFSRQYRPGKCLLRHSRKKKRLSRLLKHEVHKVEQLTFFQRVQVPKRPFFQLFFIRKYTGKMSFTIFWNKKTPFQAIKTRTLKSREIDIYSKGLIHGFGRKMGIFPTFFFREHRPGKCLLRYSRTKKRLSWL